ncbi:MAG: hypothetical protein WC965_01055 [Thiohalomonadaceae bacterium]
MANFRYTIGSYDEVHCEEDLTGLFENYLNDQSNEQYVALYIPDLLDVELAPADFIREYLPELYATAEADWYAHHVEEVEGRVTAGYDSDYAYDARRDEG